MASIHVGDLVTVPGEMYGTVKFVGSVLGKKGTFAGVQLAPEFAGRGKNSGEVDGKYYFRATIPGSGIFLPVDKAIKRNSGGSAAGFRASPISQPGTPTLGSFNQGGRTASGLARPSFSQSVGPGAMRASGAASPALKPPMRRESLPRPSSPLRKVNTPAAKAMQTPRTRPSIGLAKSTMGNAPQYKSSVGPRPMGNKFSQSLRQSGMPSNMNGGSPLGPEPSFDEVPEEEVSTTPTPTPNWKKTVESDNRAQAEEVRRLRANLEERDRQLQDQANSIADMERNLTELQKLVPELAEDDQGAQRSRDADEEDLPRDIASLRAIVREKNEKIKLLTAEFDANRADFRSTIDTLELASTETERVYEKRVDELLEEVRGLQDRSEDVESVAQQLRQLEELVQELEEGLEDARRGEAEARGEVEFLRGEVERSRSELRRERERLRTEEQLNGYSEAAGEKIAELEAQLNSKDDEIRGMKAMLHNLHGDDEFTSPRLSKAAHNHTRNDSTDHTFSLEKQIRDLELLLQKKSAHEEELENEVTILRNSVHINKFPMPSSAFGLRSGYASHSRENSAGEKHKSSGTTGSQRTVVLGKDSRQEWHDAPSRSASPTKLATVPDHDEKASEGDITDTSSAALWCEICEEGGHDILTCSNMFGNKNGDKTEVVQNGNHDETNYPDRPAPLMSRKINVSSPPESLPANPGGDDDGDKTPRPDNDHPRTTAASGKAPIEGTGAQAGMWAGKTSGVIDPEKWCALCERDGHDSVDCPIEDAF